MFKSGSTKIWLIYLGLCLLLTACTDQPSEQLTLPTPTSNPIQSTAQAELPPPSTPTPVIVLRAATPEPTLAVDHNIINVPGNTVPAATATPTPPPAQLPKLSSQLPDLTTLPALTDNPTEARLLARYLDGATDAKGQPQPILAVAVSPDHKWLALADRAQIWVVGLTDGKLLKTLYSESSEWYERGAHSLAWSPDGSLLAAGGLNGIITMWRWDRLSNSFRVGPQRLAPSAMAEAFGDAVEVAFSPDGKQLAGFGSDGTITVYLADTGQPKRSFNSEFAGYFSWSPDSKRLADEFFLIHSLDTGLSVQPGETVASDADGPAGIAWSPDGKQLAGSGDGFELLLADAPPTDQPNAGVMTVTQQVKLRTGSDQTSLPHLREGRRVAWSPSGRWVVVANVPAAGKLSLYDATGGLLLTLEAGNDPLTTLAWPQDNLLITGGNDGSVRLWQLIGPPPPTPTPTAPPTTPGPTTPAP